MPIRPAEHNDLPAIYDILCYWIDHSCSNLAWDRPAYDRFVLEQKAIGHDYPYLVAEYEGQVIGFGYAHAFLAKDSYQYDAEITIYFREGKHHHLAGALYEKLEEICREMGIVRLVSCTTAGNEPSLGYQKRHGFKQFGYLENAGYKNGEWHAVAWLEKQINPYENPHRCPLPKELKKL